MCKKPIYILGTNLSHDGSSCLLKDGKIVVAIEKERLSRVKHDGGNDLDTVKYCLDVEGIGIDQLSLIVQNANFEKDEIKIDSYKGKRYFDKDIDIPVVSISHHLAHAYSAIGTSNFEDCNVMVIDGCGSPFYQCDDLEGELFPKKELMQNSIESFWCEKLSFYKYHINDGLIPLVKEFSEFNHILNSEYKMPSTIHSIGGVYSFVSNYCFGDINDVGKLMGLAPFGDAGKFDEDIFELKDGKVFNLLKWQKLLNKPFINYENFKKDFQHYADLAAWVQEETQKALIYSFEFFQKKYPNKNWAYAGGVALNAVANEKILKNIDIKSLYIQPAASDCGISLGCAFYGWNKILNKQLKKHDGSSNFGKKYKDKIDFDSFDLEKIQTDNYIEKTAEFLEKGSIIAWFSGGSEFGPRALGHRSILANPMKKDVKDFINKEIKKREDFRPFAPAIMEENVGDYFENKTKSPYMILVNPMKDKFKGILSDIVHKNGTSRVQTVNKDTNYAFYNLLKSFKEKSEIPILLNTSLNKKGMPIVETPIEAIEFFKEAPLDYLVIDGKIYKKIKDKNEK